MTTAREREEEMSKNHHWSDCSLHNGPAMRPKWCDCGGFDGEPSVWSNFKLWALMNWLYFANRL